MNLNDETAKKIILDPTDFKLVLAKKFLEKTDFSVEFNLNKNQFNLELCSEAFLFFASSVTEILTNEINERFQIYQRQQYQMKSLNLSSFPDETKYPDFTIYDIRDRLDQSIVDQKKVYDLIIKYFEIPTRIGENWNTNNSSLWFLRELRNHVAHERILNKHYNIIIGGDTESNANYLFRFRIEKPRNNDKGIFLVNVVSNPKNFFQKIFDDLVEFRIEIRKIIPYTHESSQYNNQLDFGLKF